MAGRKSPRKEKPFFCLILLRCDPITLVESLFSCSAFAFCMFLSPRRVPLAPPTASCAMTWSEIPSLRFRQHVPKKQVYTWTLKLPIKLGYHPIILGVNPIVQGILRVQVVVFRRGKPRQGPRRRAAFVPFPAAAEEDRSAKWPFGVSWMEWWQWGASFACWWLRACACTRVLLAEVWGQGR